MSNSNKKTDAELIAEAAKVHYIDWPMIDNLIDQAESEEAKKELRRIQVSLYHKEEASCGCL